MVIRAKMRIASARCIAKNPAIRLALRLGENFGLSTLHRVRSVTVTPRNPIASSKIAVNLSIKSALLARSRSQCHHNGSIAARASAIWILRQVLGLMDDEVFGLLEGLRAGKF